MPNEVNQEESEQDVINATKKDSRTLIPQVR